MYKISDVINAMIEYYGGDVYGINHFLKVYGYAKTIGEKENLDSGTQEILEIAAVVHDIGIKVSIQKYHSGAGNYQQIEGPPIAEDMLNRLNYDPELVERVCYLIAHHHTYHDIQGLDYQILVEADFLVNIFENNMKASEIANIKNNIFKTKVGLQLLEHMYAIS